MSIPWHTQRLAALDFESSDKDPETARIVTCALILVGGGLDTDKREWLLNPGVPQEPGAIKVHGITDEYAAEHGMPAEQGVGEIAKAIAEVVASGVPVVGHNIGIDVEELHRRQIGWAAADAASYQAWLRDPAKSGEKHDPNAVIDGTWPLRSVEGGGAA